MSPFDTHLSDVDKEGKHLHFCEFVGCLVGLQHSTKQFVLLPSFVNY